MLVAPPILHMHTQHCSRNHSVYTLQWELLVNQMISLYSSWYVCVGLAVNPVLWLGVHMWDWHGQISKCYYPRWWRGGDEGLEMSNGMQPCLFCNKVSAQSTISAIAKMNELMRTRDSQANQNGVWSKPGRRPAEEVSSRWGSSRRPHHWSGDLYSSA